MIFAGLKALAQSRISWDDWEGLIGRNGITIDRPRGSPHPEFSQIVYPIDYGYVNDTLATDGGGVDLFRGSTRTGLVGTVITVDHRKGDTEFKLLFDCSPEDIYLVNGFINFDRDLMEGVLVLRRTMAEIRAMAGT